MRLVVVLWSILAAVVANVKCTDVDDESSSEAKPLIVDGALEFTDELRESGMTEEMFQRLLGHLQLVGKAEGGEKGKSVVQRVQGNLELLGKVEGGENGKSVVSVVRTDTFDCGEEGAKRLYAALGKVSVFAKNARRIKAFDQENRAKSYAFPPQITFSTEARPSRSSSCQLITEVEARERGKGDDGKPIVDVWEGCWVRQSLHTVKGSHYYDEKPQKKRNCRVLLAMADAVEIKVSGKWVVESMFYGKKFDSIPCHIVKTRDFSTDKLKFLDFDFSTDKLKKLSLPDMRHTKDKMRKLGRNIGRSRVGIVVGGTLAVATGTGLGYYVGALTGGLALGGPIGATVGALGILTLVIVAIVVYEDMRKDADLWECI